MSIAGRLYPVDVPARYPATYAAERLTLLSGDFPESRVPVAMSG